MTRHPPLPSAFDYLVLAPSANPFLLRWAPPGTRQGQSPVIGSGYDQVRAPRTVEMRGGYSMHPGDQTENPQPVGTWHHVSIEPREAMLPPGTSIVGIDASAVESRGNRASMLKSRIKIAMGNGRTRDFDFDVGAGVEFDVRAYAVLGIDALVPDPDGGGLTPEEVSSNPFALGTIFTTACYCASSNSHEKNPLTYTQSFLVGETGLTMPVMPIAREVYFLIDNVDAAPLTLDFIYGFTNPILPANATPTFPFVELGSVTIPAGSTTSPTVMIPGDANAMVLSAPGGQAIVTIVQILNL